MEAKRSQKRWTYEEYAKLPESGTTRYEVIAGDLAVTPSPTIGHQRVIGRLFRALADFVEANALGEVFPSPLDVLFGEGDYLQPDLIFVRAENAHLVSKRGIEGPPDLVIEVRSPSTAHRDRGIKLDRYRHFGVPEYWIVDPEARTVEVWRFGAADSAAVFGVGDRFSWAPAPAGPKLDLEISRIVPAT